MMPNMRRRAWSNFVDSPPTNAWLLVGDEASRPGDDELSDFRRSWRAAETLWTSPKQVQPGDLLFFYFISPIKAVHFAARAASYPFFDSSITVNAYKKVSDHQWWVRYTPMVPVEPGDLCPAAGYYGRSPHLERSTRALPASCGGRQDHVKDGEGPADAH